jgi:hypothetical protein
MIAVFTNAYQEFAYEKSLAKELYKSKRKSAYNEDSVENPKE